MANQFTYSVLQYKHSLLLNETVNVGIVFYFPNEDKTYFYIGDIQRVKCLYPNFDASILNTITKDIKNRLGSPKHDLFTNQTFSEYLNTILLPDATSLQFSESFTATDAFEDTKKTMEEFCRLLLPNNQVAKEVTYSHDENYLLKKLTDSIVKKDIVIAHRMHRNKVIEAKGVKVNFELAWRNGVMHLIKPISFDLKQERDIQNKSVQYFGYLDLLSDYAKLHEYTFDLLIARPTNPQLYKPYENALQVLDEAVAPKDIITEDRLELYSEQTAEILRRKGLDNDNGLVDIAAS
jgi:hypothetical protein